MFEHLYSQCSTVCGFLMQIGFARIAAKLNKGSYALRSGVCFERWRVRRMVSARFEETLQSTPHKVFSYTSAVSGHLGEGSMMVGQMRAFAVLANMLTVRYTILNGCK